MTTLHNPVQSCCRDPAQKMKKPTQNRAFIDFPITAMRSQSSLNSRSNRISRIKRAAPGQHSD